jgi:ketosteroid isomerase-like protein
VSEPETVAIATKCLQAWSSGDFETARSLVRDDVTFVGPLGSAGGIDAYMGRLIDLAQQVTSAEPKKVLVDGDDVCIIYDLFTNSAGVVPTSDWYHVKDGMIDSVHAYFDARPLASAGDDHGHTSGRVPRTGRTSPTGLPALVSAEMELAHTSM